MAASDSYAVQAGLQGDTLLTFVSGLMLRIKGDGVVYEINSNEHYTRLSG